MGPKQATRPKTLQIVLLLLLFLIFLFFYVVDGKPDYGIQMRVWNAASLLDPVSYTVAGAKISGGFTG
jgi:hypothetical protein